MKARSKAKPSGQKAAPYETGAIVSGLRYDNGTVLVLQRVTKVKARSADSWEITTEDSKGEAGTYFVSGDGQSDYVGPYDEACRNRLYSNGGEQMVNAMDLEAQRLNSLGAEELGQLFS